jgi:periplasmic protein TonB
MQSTGYLENRPRPAAIVAVVAIHAAGIGALLMIAPTVVDTVIRPPFEGYNIRVEKPPKVVEDQKPIIKMRTLVRDNQVKPIIDSPPLGVDTGLTRDTGPLVDAGTGEGLGGGIDMIDIDPPHLPVVVSPRFVGGNAQPPYPPGLQRMNIEGAVTVRVLVGVDGRPLRIEAVKVDQDAFFAATRDWAMKHWRFAPATRDGEPFQEWRTMTVRFEMN